MYFDTNYAEILYEGGVLKVVYQTDSMIRPIIAVDAKSYSEFNNKAMKLFGATQWAEYIIWMYFEDDEEFCDPDFANSLTLVKILADIYTNHREVYDVAMKWYQDYLKSKASDKQEDKDFNDTCNGENCNKCQFNDICDEGSEMATDDQSYDFVNEPDHYNGLECIENMRSLYGDEAVRHFCICNAYKYRFRKGKKPGCDSDQDEQKAYWYEDYAVSMTKEANDCEV